MLLNIPPSFTPDFLKYMMAMGHGEELLLSDGNYPVLSAGDPSKPRIYLPVADMASLLEDVLRFFPLDYTVDAPLTVMESALESGAHAQYQEVIGKMKLEVSIATMERFEFYRRASSAAVIAVTASTVKGGNILIKKGVVRSIEKK